MGISLQSVHWTVSSSCIHRDNRRKKMLCPKCGTKIGLVQGTMNEPCQSCRDKKVQDKFANYTWFVLALGALMVIFAIFANSADAQDSLIELQADMAICNTQEQMEEFVKMGYENPKMYGVDIALAINKKYDVKNACGILERSIPGLMLGEVNRFKQGDVTIIIYKVIAVFTPPVGVSQFIFEVVQEEGQSI